MLHKVLTLFEASYNYVFWTLYLPNDFASKRVLVIFIPIQAGVFRNHISWDEHIVPPSVSPLLVIQLQPNLAWWYSGKIISQKSQKFCFLIFFLIEMKFGTGVNSEALISNPSQKNPIQIRFEGEKCHFLTKNWNFCPSAPRQKCFHGNTLGYYFKWCPI